MKKLVIDRSKWQRRSNLKNSNLILSSISELLCNNDRLCCLGFDCLRRGFKRKQILEKADPESIVYGLKNKQSIKKVIKKLNGLISVSKGRSDEIEDLIHNSAVCTQLIKVNDNPRISERVKESRITKMFSMIGVEVEFIGPSLKEEIENYKD